MTSHLNHFRPGESTIGFKCPHCLGDQVAIFLLKDVTITSTEAGLKGVVSMQLYNRDVVVSLPCPCLQHSPAMYTHARALARGICP